MAGRLSDEEIISCPVFITGFPFLSRTVSVLFFSVIEGQFLNSAPAIETLLL